MNKLDDISIEKLWTTKDKRVERDDIMKCSWVVYILCCSDGKLYTGVTNNIENRINAHNAGEASKFTRARLPVKLLAVSRFMSKEDAYRLEYRIKKLPKDKKLPALKDGEFGL